MKRAMNKLEFVVVMGLMVVSVAALVMSGGGLSFAPMVLAGNAPQVTSVGGNEPGTILTPWTGTSKVLPAALSGSGAAGQVTFWTGNESLSGDNNLYWNNTDKRLVITAGPSYTARPLHLIGNICLFERAQNSAGFIINRTGGTGYNRWVFGADEPTGFVIKTYPVDGGPAVEQLVITKDDPATAEVNESNVGIGTTSPTAKLEVNGSVKISDSINRQPTNPPLFRWLPVEVLATYTGTGGIPYGIAFDGTNMWTATYSNNGVTKITPTGVMTNYTGTGASPQAIAFDGTYMWTANFGGDSVTKIDPTGTIIATYDIGTGTGPCAIAFDGTYMWTANVAGDSVTKISSTGGVTPYSIGTGTHPRAIAFDGTNMWTANSGNNSVTKIAPDGTPTTYPGTGIQPYGIAFDGTNMWTANWSGNNVTKIAPDGTPTTYPGTGLNPWAIAFDGTNMWTANYIGNNVTKITPTGVMTNYGPTGPNPIAIAFDGTNMWTANYGAASVTKILAVTR